MRIVPGKEHEALLADLEARVGRLEKGPKGRVELANGSRIGDVIFETERSPSGDLLLYAKDAKGGVRVLVATVA